MYAILEDYKVIFGPNINILRTIAKKYKKEIICIKKLVNI